jgi:hypothetical protein
LLGYLYARTGRTDQAREILRQLREQSKQRYVLAFNLAGWTLAVLSPALRQPLGGKLSVSQRRRRAVRGSAERVR